MSMTTRYGCFWVAIPSLYDSVIRYSMPVYPSAIRTGGLPGGRPPHSYFNATTGWILEARHPGTSAAAMATSASSAAQAMKTTGSTAFMP